MQRRRFTEDEEGRELADLDAARQNAVREARSIMAAEMRDGVLNLASFIEIEDKAAGTSVTLPFSEAVRIET
ncbi:MAG: DUF6894 family protein [Allosphingosinicella sp.]